MGAKQSSFKRNLLATSISSCILATVSAGAIAQEEKVLEEVLVTGIRASVEASMDMKREATGVVDAISAEDIGKFPDTNLAESLQRITGVSISRSNGEGSQVTVRGFGAQYNMITLNGRMLPGGGAEGGGNSIGRAFDFGNIASEAVRSLEVYKTGKANITTGGIGATININTTKPIEGDGLTTSVGVKAVMDTTNRVGDDMTPELSGLVSYADEDNTYGVSLSASHQVRDSGNSSSSVNDWRVAPWGTPGAINDDAVVTNPPEEGQLFALPNDVRYHFQDNHRERTNAQLTLQFRPMETLTGTVDYTFAENSYESARGDKTAWFTRTTDTVTFDDGEVATSILIAEDTNRKDLSFSQQSLAQKNTLSSFGVNLELEVQEGWTVALDAHDSEMESLPDGGVWGGFVGASIATPVGTYQSYDFTGDLPIVNHIIDDSGTNGNDDGIWNLQDLGSQILQFGYASQVQDVQQVKIDSTIEFDQGKIDFGIETRAMSNFLNQSNTNRTMGDWGVTQNGDVPDDLIENFNYLADFNGYALPNALSQAGFKGDAVAIGMWGAETYGDQYGYEFAYKADMDDSEKVEEDTNALYFQATLESELGGKAVSLVTGLRYETTDSKSISNIYLPDELTWTDNNDFNLARLGTRSSVTIENSYDHLLPNIDFGVDVTDDVKARASYSQTIARPGFGDLRAGVSGFASDAPTYLGGTPTAVAGNPMLVPLQSNNVDLSLEWYFDDASYVSGGFYEKRVINFIGNAQFNENHYDMRDATAGPRAERAAAALADLGMSVGETELFVMTAVLNNPLAFPNGADDYQDLNYPRPRVDAMGNPLVDMNGDPVPHTKQTFDQFAAADYNISGLRTGVDEDPLIDFLTQRPVNNEAAKISGFELAAQHFFGETGFGVQANYTTVSGDVKFDNAGDPSISQFALVGLSDTANLVLMYDNYGVEARLAYNWRDEYLTNPSRGSSRSPEYVEAYSQIDLNVGYEVMDGLTVFAEGINLTGENSRSHGRSERQMWSLFELGPRYTLGARYSF